MESIEDKVSGFTDVDELTNFAVTFGIRESPCVRLRLFQLENPEYDEEFVGEQLDDILTNLAITPISGEFQMALGYVAEQEEMDATAQTCLEDGEWAPQASPLQTDDQQPGPSHADEMDAIAQACLEDGEWSPVQNGDGEEPRAGPSHQPDPLPGPSRDPDVQDIRYTIRKKSERTYAKNAAVDRTYQIKIDEDHQGQRLIDIQRGLRRMFNDVLDQARGDLAGNDLGRVVIHHEGLQDPVVIPLQPWDNLDADTVMGTIEKVLNSKQDLSVDSSFEISIGSIDLPKGGARRKITRLRGKNNSLYLKTSIVTIENDDHLCMARAIGVAWAKLHRCGREEWKDITKERRGRSNLELSLQHRKVPESYFKHIRKKNKPQQRDLAIALSRLAGIPLDRPASLNDIEAFEKILDIRVMVVSSRLGNKFVTTSSIDGRPCVYIYLVDDDHFHAITSITGFFCSSYFCHECLQHYNNREKHQCETHCIVCKRDDCLKTDSPVECTKCNMTCRSTDCYRSHLEPAKYTKGKHKGEASRPSQCTNWWKCNTCYKVVNTTKRNKEEHRCGEYLCTSCEEYVLDDHLCYLRATPAELDFIPQYIFFDFECSQDEVLECDQGYEPKKKPNCQTCTVDKTCMACSKCRNCCQSYCGKATHKPNFVVAHTVCPKCIDKTLTPTSVCNACGTRCDECAFEDDDEDDGPCPGTCGRRETVFRGSNTTTKFCEWLFTDQHRYFKAIAHNMKGYDGYFVLEYLIDQGVRPDKIIYNGSKIMYMTVEKDLHIKIIDSLNFLPMKLSALPKAFGLHELKKGWFPHFFNTRDNQNYSGPYPDPKYYGCEFMGNKEREELLTWHETKKDELFDFRQEMLDYCRSDVDILRQACLRFQHLLRSSTGEEKEVINAKGMLEKQLVGAVDPFNSVTIASVCMSMYRTKFLDEEVKVQLNNVSKWIPAKRIDGELSVLREGEWVAEAELEQKVTRQKFHSTAIAKIPPGGYKKDQYSKSSIEWLEWMSKTQGVKIQHALNGGEKTLVGTRYKLDGFCKETNEAYEYNGCVFHGCSRCFPVDRDETIHPLTDQSMLELYALTQKKKKYIKGLGMKYVCIWEHDFVQQCKENEQLRNFIASLDVTDRLDPRDSFFGGRTNASQLYHKVKDDEQIKYVDFTSLYPWVNKYCQYPVGHPTIITTDFKDLSHYFGIAKVKVLPPRGLYHPVLPYRSNGKLKFPLCRKCADNENQQSCTCNDGARAITGTWCTAELQKAVGMGYKIVKIYEVYQWDKTTQYDSDTREGGLFAKYINTFLKFKQEASGPPDWIKTDEDMDKYIGQYFEKEGVVLEQDYIEKNSGLRALSKLCLNSFWGKFGQRLNMKQTNYFHETEANQFFQTLSDPLKQVSNFHIVADDTIQMEWTYKKDCLPEDNKTNIYLATFTTCWARLKLYSVLEQLDRRVLYYDTDSVIYVSKPGHYDPPLGDYLGELTDELGGGDHIVEFVSGGPKNYAYKTNKNEETCKVRGFTLNYTNSKLINFEAVKQLVTDPKCPQNITITNAKKICRDKRKRKLYNREEDKNYRMVYTKRRRLDNFDTVPYGY